MRPAASSAAAVRLRTCISQQQHIRTLTSSTSAIPSHALPFTPIPSSSSSSTSPKPPLKTWYTGRPALSAFLQSLQDTLQTTRSALYRAGYLESIDASPSHSSSSSNGLAQSATTRWISADDMASALSLSKVRLAYYRRITGLLSELNALQPLAHSLDREGLPTLHADARGLEELLRRFKKVDARLASASSAVAGTDQTALSVEGAPARGEKSRKQGYVDPKSGIAYGLGKKKESSARAWILPLPEPASPSKRSSSAEISSSETVSLGPGDVSSAIQENSNEVLAEKAKQASSATVSDPQSAESLDPLDLSTFPNFSPSSSSSAQSNIDLSALPLGKVLVNNLSLTTYFSSAAERSVLLRPFKITSTLARYNVWLLVSGGGVSAQAAAAASACARALAALGDAEAAPERRAILSKADLLRRDPRVVERKKTGRPKARKRYTWVKR